MRLTCPNCGARYEVDDALIPPEGRDVQCSDCVTTWFQAGRRTSMPDAPAARPPFVEEADAEDEVVDAPEAAEEEIEASDVHPPADADEDAVPDLETVHETAETESTAEAPADEAVDQPGMADDADADTAEDIPPQTVHVHEPDEEVLAEIPESVESATQVVGENDTPEIDEAEDAEPAEEMAVVASSDMGGARREIDPGVRDILREEAEREARLRKAEADPVETQSEMPLDEAPEDEHRARRRAELEDAEDAFAVGAASAGHANGSRRDLLPDIEEINSTLRASEDRGGDAQDDAATRDRAAAAERRRGVRLGFFTTLALTAGLIWVYVNADMLSETVPAVAGAVEGFTDQVDVARFWLDDLARGLATSEDGS
jgi:predicted Zn finger-like uncharacterized protein